MGLAQVGRFHPPNPCIADQRDRAPEQGCLGDRAGHQRLHPALGRDDELPDLSRLPIDPETGEPIIDDMLFRKLAARLSMLPPGDELGCVEPPEDE